MCDLTGVISQTRERDTEDTGKETTDTAKEGQQKKKQRRVCMQGSDDDDDHGIDPR